MFVQPTVDSVESAVDFVEPAAHFSHERLKLLSYGFRHHGVQPLFRSIGDHGFGAGVQQANGLE